ncbi:hypothetical protein PO124_27360 [Bacillus licheniformis]|nr:hypothetical protein [Bacillus licheniformis]
MKQHVQHAVQLLAVSGLVCFMLSSLSIIEELMKLRISEPSGDRSAGASMMSIRIIFMALPSIPLISNGLDRS